MLSGALSGFLNSAGLGDLTAGLDVDVSPLLDFAGYLASGRTADLLIDRMDDIIDLTALVGVFTRLY